MGIQRTFKQVQGRVERLIEWVKTFRVVRVFLHFGKRGGNLLSAGMSFQAVFALFAALYVGFATLGLAIAGNTELQHAIVEQLNTLVPGLIGEQGATSLDSLIQAEILGWTGALAAVSLISVAVGWLATAREAIRRMMAVPVVPSNAFLLKLRDFGLAAVLAVGIVISAVLMILSSSLLTTVLTCVGVAEDSWFFGTLTRVVALLVMFVFDAILLMSIYRVLSGVRVNRGILIRVSVVGGAALAVIQLLGSQLASGAGNNPLLASFATLIGILVWFNLICRILLLGAAWISVESEDRFGFAPGHTPDMGDPGATEITTTTEATTTSGVPPRATRRGRRRGRIEPPAM
ncbi:hypothetical protein GCM10022198_10550 [Klugiella xanthotipulae]|uniref:Membrane protein n=1 Tax=Klugiella xanthotipulae TaxID=244735 RepID=A0A543HYN5_9MICO|nr:YhjD/YihY/BrkB family envelope integrity protein [Klugiella xanthotipulae]TQM63453.1 membrane protein [Klugiella xanthotipulae]